MSDKKIELFKLGLDKHMNQLSSASQSYDKAILSLATATLGFTFAFIKLLKPLNYDCLLRFIWFFLIASILSILISFLIDQIHCEHRIKYFYSSILKGGKIVEQDHWTDKMFIFSILAGLFFVIGITLFTILVGINIY